MRKRKVMLPVFVALVAAVSCAEPRAPTPVAAATAAPPAAVDASDTAESLHRSAIVIDTHDDVTQRLVVEGANLANRLPDGQTDIPRMREGGLDAEFLSVFVPPA